MLPTGEGDGRCPWILLSLIVVPRDEDAPSRAETAVELASLLVEAQQATSTSSGSIRESYRRDVCTSLNLDIFVTFMGRLEEMSHRQVSTCVRACVPPACTQCFTGVRIEHHIRAFQGLNSVLTHYFFFSFQYMSNGTRNSTITSCWSWEARSRRCFSNWPTRSPGMSLLSN